MDIRKLQRVIVDGLEDVKAQNIAVFNTEHLSALFERVIIASGTSNRQTKSLASSVRDAVKTAGYPVPRTEGESNGEWIIVDCGAAVVHVMQPTIRDYYRLEEIWGDKPVNMKLAGGTARLVKAAEPAAPARKPAAKQPVAKKAAAKKAPTRAASARTPPKAPAGAPSRAPSRAPTTTASRAPATAPSRKAAAANAPVARKAPARKVVPPGKVVTRVVGVKSAPAKKASAKAAPVTKAAAKAAPAKKAPARKTPRRA